MSSDSADAKVSIVIPLYNMGSYIGPALDSVLAQTFTDWEALVVDDGSADEGPAIVQRYAAVHPQKIRLLEHPDRRNRGVSASRNLALDMARGEFVAFLDADDLWTPDKLDRQMEVFETHPEVGLVYSSAQPIRADGKPWSPSDGESPVKMVYARAGEPRVGYGTPNQPVALFEELVRHCCLVNSAVIVRKTALLKADRFDETMRYCEDWLFYTCVAYHTLCYFIEEPLVRYRIHTQHFSASLFGNELAEVQGTATFLRRLPARLDADDSKLKRLLSENRRSLFGRALTRAEDAWLMGQKADAKALARFAWTAFPAQFFSRRTARFLWRICTGTDRSQRQLESADRSRDTGETS